MRTIAIMNNKGGVGKTVTAINLADILVHDYHKRVVLVDCDGQMNLTRFYQPEFDPELNLNIANVLEGSSETVWSDNLMPISPGLDMLPASTALYRLDVDSIKQGNFTLRTLRDFKNCAAEDAETDYFIFDCPPGFTAASCAALMASDEVVIPMLVDGFSMTGMVDMAAQVGSMREANAKIRIAGVLVTQWHKTDAVIQGEQLLRSLSVPVFKTVIRRTDKIPESTFDRSPIRDYSPGSAASQDYRAWVREYLGEEKTENG
jgi:chromosome partitioning protein